MLSNLIAYLFTTFALAPLQAEIERHAAAAGQPIEIVKQSQACLTTEGPLLLKRASEDMAWTISTVVGMATGWSDPADLLNKNNPDCTVVIGLLKGKGTDEA